MSLQELIESNDVDLSADQVQAFFLGAQSGVKPLPFNKAMDELLAEYPEAKKPLEKDFKTLWESLGKTKKQNLKDLFPASKDVKSFLENALPKLDSFLTGLSLAGSVKDEVEEVTEELENIVMDLDDYLLEGNSELDAEDIKDQLLGTWEEYLKLT